MLYNAIDKQGNREKVCPKMKGALNYSTKSRKSKRFFLIIVQLTLPIKFFYYLQNNSQWNAALILLRN